MIVFSDITNTTSTSTIYITTTTWVGCLFFVNEGGSYEGVGSLSKRIPQQSTLIAIYIYIYIYIERERDTERERDIEIEIEIEIEMYIHIYIYIYIEREI